MKKILSIVCLAVSISAFGQSYSLNTTSGTVNFKFVKEDARGSLTGVEAKINIDPSNLGSSTVSGSVPVSTLTTGNKTRDKHLMSDEFFDVAKFPNMSFETGTIEKDGDVYKAKGKLTIKGTTKDVTFTVKEAEGTLQFKATIYSLDFGVSSEKARDDSKVYVLVKIPLS